MESKYDRIIEKLGDMIDSSSVISGAYTAAERDRGDLDRELVEDVDEVLRNNPDLPDNFKQIADGLMDVYEELILKWREEGKLSESGEVEMMVIEFEDNKE